MGTNLACSKTFLYENNTMMEKAYQFCQQLTKKHTENFPVASLAIPKNIRPHIAAVYAFARTADDFADETAFEGERMAKLKAWEDELKNSIIKKTTHPVFLALSDTIKKFNLPITLFLDLLTAFKMDVVVTRFQTYEQLLGYCRYSANPVGRIILHLMGYPAPKFLEYSDAICTALQLANFWQDIEIDLAKGRIYIPLEDMHRFGCPETNLLQKTYDQNFERLLYFEVDRTFELFNKGKPLLNSIHGRFGFELKLTWMGGVSILKKIQQVKGNIFAKRPVLRKKDWAGLIIKALFRKI